MQGADIIQPKGRSRLQSVKSGIWVGCFWLALLLGPAWAVGQTGDPMTLVALQDSAQVLSKQGDYQEALETNERLLAQIRLAATDSIVLEVKTLLRMVTNFRKLGLLESSYQTLEEARCIAEENLPENHPLRYDVYHKLGIHYYRQSQFDTSLFFYFQALEGRRGLYGDVHASVADVYSNIALDLMMLGDYDGAIGYFERVLDQRIELYGDCDQLVAHTYLNLGTAYHYMGDLDEALQYYQQTLEIYDEQLEPGHPDYFMVFNNMGVGYQNKGDYRRAQELLERALEHQLAIHSPDHLDVANAYNNLGLHHFDNGDYDKALTFYQRALRIRKMQLDPNHRLLGNVYNNLSNTYRLRRQYPEALEYGQKALAIRDSLYDDLHPEVAESLNDLGLYYEDVAEYEKALDYYRQALSINREVRGEWHATLADSWERMGNCYLASSDPERAREHYLKALAIRKKTQDARHPDLLDLQTKLGKVYPDDPTRGLEWVTQSLELMGLEKVARANALRVTFPLQALNALGVRGDLHMELFRRTGNLEWLERAADNYQLARTIIEITRRRYQEPASKQLLLDNYFQIYEQSLEVAFIRYQLGESQEALEEGLKIAEFSKNVLLLESMQKAQADQFAGLPDSLYQLETDLKLDMAFYEQQAFDEESKGESASTQRLAEIGDKLFQIKRNYYLLLDTLAARYPDYYELRYGKPKLSVEALQDSLAGSGQDLVGYFLGEKYLYTFVVTPDTARMLQQNLDFQLEDAVRRIRQEIEYYQPGQADNEVRKAQFLEEAHFLYQLLLEPAKPWLKQDRLIIVPDGILGYLPFEVLLERKPGPETSWRDPGFVLHQYKVSYQYAISLVVTPKTSMQSAARNLLAIAPEFSAASQQATRFQLDSLRYNQEEVGRLKNLTRGTFLLGDKASEERFLSLAPDYRILHLATHAQANDTIGVYSFLAFAPIPDSLENEYLYLSDLYNMQLGAELVVLSACETGVGEWKRGEGIVSLGRGFLYAGARSIVTTLWNIDDRPTAEIMNQFYAQLAAGKEKDEALQLAKLDYLRNNSSLRTHPVYWAGFIGIGDMEAIQMDPATASNWLWGIPIICFLGFGLWWWRRG
jgi:tetratricopeptide (TPR) repeat protein